MVGGLLALGLVTLGASCGDDVEQPPPLEEEPQPPLVPPDENPPRPPGGKPDGKPDSGTPDAGTPDSGTPDAGTPDAGTSDGGTEPTPAGGTNPGGPGPWPTDAVLNYSATYGVGAPQSVGVDDAYNIWLLKGDQIGVLRPGDTQPTWTRGVGQAAGGFSVQGKAMASSVICGGAAGRAYVGYITYALPNPEIADPSNPEYQKGDMDLVQVNADGTVSLETHLGRTTSNSGHNALGIRNTNNWWYDEDRGVLACTKVMRGMNRGDVFIGTNHGVTRIRGDMYNSHIHPIWYYRNGGWDPTCGAQGSGCSQRAGETYAVSISKRGEVLIGNDWMLGIAIPTPNLADWDRSNLTPFQMASHVPELNSMEAFDYWRGFAHMGPGPSMRIGNQDRQTEIYYLGSKDFGLWKLTAARRVDSNRYDPFFARVNAPSNNVTALQDTDSGVIFVGTGAGLYRMDAAESFTHVPQVPGAVKQLVYDPTVTPSMLYVLTSNGLWVLRGH